MHITEDILITYGAVARKYEKGSYLFHEDSMPYYFYQILSGVVKLFSTSPEGRELTQGFFTDGQSFGEPPLLLGKCYPSTAQAVADSVVVKLRKEHFQSILHDYPELYQRLLYTFASRIYHKATAAQIWVRQTPEQKIVHFLKTNKASHTANAMEQVPYTRQQIADFTGLRVETVIRTLMKMKAKRLVKIDDHKLYY
jgi:CRP/FNR family transcriptional regulator